MHLTIDENPNCDAIDVRVFQERSQPQKVLQALRRHRGNEIWCDVVSVNSLGQFAPALARKTDDSGDGTCYLVTGAQWGVRLRPAGSPGAWSLENKDQWGEPFLLLPSDGNDLRFL